MKYKGNGLEEREGGGEESGESESLGFQEKNNNTKKLGVFFRPLDLMWAEALDGCDGEYILLRNLKRLSDAILLSESTRGRL